MSHVGLWPNGTRRTFHRALTYGAWNGNGPPGATLAGRGRKSVTKALCCAGACTGCWPTGPANWSTITRPRSHAPNCRPVAPRSAAPWPAAVVSKSARALAVCGDGQPLRPARGHGILSSPHGCGQRPRRARFARTQRHLHRAAAPMIPATARFLEAPPPGDELASLIILCCNEVHFTRRCLESVFAAHPPAVTNWSWWTMARPTARPPTWRRCAPVPARSASKSSATRSIKAFPPVVIRD